MNDLTEQWKTWKLETFKWYFVKFKTGETDICWLTECDDEELGTGEPYFDGIKEENITEVLAPVPSYEEYQKLRDLLKDCRNELFWVYSNEISHPEDVPVIQKLDEALK